MRAYLIYKDKTVKGFKKLTNAGSGIFDKYRSKAVQFIRYASSDLDNNLAQYDDILDLNTINLEDIFPAKYKWLVRNIVLKQSSGYLKSIEDRIGEFKGSKEKNLKAMVGLQFLRFVLLTKIVETYLEIAANMKSQGIDVKKLDLNDVGITKQILKYYDDLEILGDKSIDDWLNTNIDEAEANKFFSSMKRILTILMSRDITKEA